MSDVANAAPPEPMAVRKRFRPLQAVAIVGSGVLAVMTTAALIHLALGGVALPTVLHDWIPIVHLVLIYAVLVLTFVQLILPKGTGLHLILGYAWSAALIASASVSFGMHLINGGFSVPHWFSVGTLIFVPLIIFLARTRHVEAHRSVVILFVLIFLVLAGVFAFRGEERALSQMFWSIWR